MITGLFLSTDYVSYKMDFASTSRSIVYGILSGSTIEFPGNCDPAIVWEIPPLKAGCGVKGSNKSFIFKNMTPELEALIKFLYQQSSYSKY